MITKDQYEYYLQQIRLEYDRLDKICNIDTRMVTLKISSRLTRKYGYFQVKQVGKFKVLDLSFDRSELSITFSDRIFDNGKLFVEVIRHEYAHAVAYLRNPKEKPGHNASWKAVCKEVGCEPRAYIESDTGTKTARRPAKYILRCKKCGSVSKYTRMCETVKIATGKTPGTIWCSKCGSKSFELEYL